ncbi:MAG: N-acetylneuraminate synthase [Nitrososphaera sp.]
MGHGEPCFVIAEAGVNHNGKLSTAKRLVDAAYNAGADAIKFQTFVTQNLVSRALSRKQFDMLKKLELDKDSFLELRDYASSRKLVFFSTPFDMESVRLLHKEVDVPLFKISSGDLDNLPLLRAVAKTGRPMIVSTGMSTMDEISGAVDAVGPYCKGLVLTHCTSLYPPAFNEINLKAMDTIKKAFGAPVGYSDHTLGYEVSIAAVALGACVIEKHLTLDKKMAGPDHKASLDPKEFASMTKGIRNVEQALGTAEKKPVPREHKMRAYARKSITCIRDIRKGARIAAQDIAILRPGGGMEPKHFDELVGRVAQVNIRQGQQITPDMLRR